MNRHTHTQPQKRAARDKRGPRAPHTHCRHTTSATRRPAREERTAHTQFKFECDRAPSECAGPGSRRGRRHGFRLTATARPRDGGTVAAVYTWNSLSIDGPGGRRAVLFGPTAHRSREGNINGEPGRRHEADRSNWNDINGQTSRPAGGLVWPDGVKASSLEGPVRRHEADRSNWNDINGQAWRPAGGLVWPNGVPAWRRQHQCKSLDRPIRFPRGAVTGCENVLSPMSRRREVRSLRADRPRG